jgi:hypothetical protein
MLKGGKGSVINMSSSGGLLARASDPVYSASKHAVMGLTKALAVTYANANIRVNALCPGPIATPMLWGTAQTKEERRARLPAILATCPAARYGSADDVARAAVFLASDESTFVSGVGLAVDGAKAAGVMPIDRYRLDFEIAAEAERQKEAEAQRTRRDSLPIFVPGPAGKPLADSDQELIWPTQRESAL